MLLTNLTIIPQYGTRVAVVPIPTDSAVLRDADKIQLAVLLAVMADKEFSFFSVAEKTGATREQIEQALSYWEKAGMLTLQSAELQPQKPAAAEKTAPMTERKLERAAELPHYNTEEAARYLETNPGTTALIDCCQQELGKIFNTSETEVIIGMRDYLSLDENYILLLCAHNAKKNRRSLRYIEKEAISLHDAGIVTYEQLEYYLKQRELVDEAEYALREMFGMGSRALIKKEKDAFARWIGEWALPLDEIRHAYEITVSHTKEPSVPYTNAILEKWHAEGWNTLEEVLRGEEARAGNAQPASGSFNTDDFFEAALQRSYGQ